jgi:hypothetical protein
LNWLLLLRKVTPRIGGNFVPLHASLLHPRLTKNTGTSVIISFFDLSILSYPDLRTTAQRKIQRRRINGARKRAELNPERKLLHWWLLNQRLSKSDFFLNVSSLFRHSLFGSLRKNFGPLLFLFLLPETFLALPMRCTIVPKVEVQIKGGADHTTELIHMKADLFREHRKTEMIVAQELNMEIQSTTP